MQNYEIDSACFFVSSFPISLFILVLDNCAVIWNPFFSTAFRDLQLDGLKVDNQCKG